ncbi:hypothetical protein O3P69_017148 [Scylla paramamosain]|uniref:Secreted protein n=1 Tax=Scylla paramamosain TaxID=85552 RepID=A0AAW0TVL0_SCYPA
MWFMQLSSLGSYWPMWSSYLRANTFLISLAGLWRRPKRGGGAKLTFCLPPTLRGPEKLCASLSSPTVVCGNQQHKKTGVRSSLAPCFRSECSNWLIIQIKRTTVTVPSASLFLPSSKDTSVTGGTKETPQASCSAHH